MPGRYLRVLIVAAATLRFTFAIAHGVDGSGDFRISFPGPYAELLNPTLWNSPDLQDTWGVKWQTYLRGPTEYLTLFPLVYLNSYAAISRFLLVAYAAVIALTCRVMWALFGIVEGRRVSGAIIYGSTLLFFPLLQAYMQREFEIVLLLALAVSYWALVQDRQLTFGSALSYMTWFKYAPLLALPYVALRRWWRALAAFLVVSAAILVTAHWVFGIQRFFNNFVPSLARGQLSALQSESAFCGATDVFGPARVFLRFTPANNTEAGIRWALCSLNDRGVWMPARATFLVLAALVLVASAAGFFRLELSRPAIEPATERWRRVWELSLVSMFYTTFFYTHYYYLIVLILPLNALLVRYTEDGVQPVRLVVWSAAYLLIGAFVLPVSAFNRVLHVDFWSWYMRHLFCFFGELTLFALVLYEYVRLPIRTISATQRDDYRHLESRA